MIPFGTHARVEDIQMHGKREKLKDVTIRPGDAVSIQDASGTRKTVLIDGIRVHNTDGTVLERNLDDPGRGQGRGRHYRHGEGGHRREDDDD